MTPCAGYLAHRGNLSILHNTLLNYIFSVSGESHLLPGVEDIPPTNGLNATTQF